MFTTQAQFCEAFLLALCASGVERIHTAQNAHRSAFEPIAKRVYAQRQIKRHGIRISNVASRGFIEEFDATLRWLQMQGFYDCRPGGNTFTPTLSAQAGMDWLHLHLDADQVQYVLDLTEDWEQPKQMSITPDELRPPQWLTEERRRAKENAKPED